MAGTRRLKRASALADQPLPHYNWGLWTVLDKLAHGWRPEEIHVQHPELSLAQIHSALSYYYENQQRFDAEIERERREVEVLAAEQADSALQQKLIELKKAR